MPYTLDEGFEAGSLILAELGKAVKEESDGGKTITMGEIVGILSKVGVKVLEDVAD